MLGVPDRAAVVQVVRQQYPYVSIKYDVQFATPAPIDVARRPSHLCVQCPCILRARSPMRLTLDGDGLVDRQEPDVALAHEDGVDDIPVRQINIRDGSRVSLDVRHHQASDVRELRKRDSSILLSHLLSPVAATISIRSALCFSNATPTSVRPVSSSSRLAASACSGSTPYLRPPGYFPRNRAHSSSSGMSGREAT